MLRYLRTMLIMPLVLVGLVLGPAVALSAGGESSRHFFNSSNQSTVPMPTATPGSTIPPTATPTVPPVRHPTPTPRTHPPRAPKPHVRPYPTPMRILPTPTPAIPSSALQLGGYWVSRIIGDRFSDTLYAYANEWLYRSRDDGATWTLVSSAPAVNGFIMNAFDPNVLYSGNGNSCSNSGSNPLHPMLKSTNGGLEWTPLPNSMGLRPLLSHAFDPDVIYAADCQWLYLSTDGGATWIPSPALAPDALWTRYVVQTAAAVYADAETGGSVLGGNWMYAGGSARDGSGAVFYSEDGGATWRQITPDVYPAPWDFTALAVDPLTVGRIWFANSEGVWASADNGRTWQSSAAGLGNVVKRGVGGAESGLNELVLHPNEQLYLGTIRGLYTKPAGGNRWEKISGTPFDFTDISGILFTESTPERLYLNTAEGVHLVQIQVQAE